MAERRLRSKRRGLNPTKAVFIYVVALGLVCYHQAGLVADWLDELALGSGGVISETAFRLAAEIRESVVPHGPAQMHQAEDQLLALAPAALLGQKPAPPPPLSGQLSQVVRKLKPLPTGFSAPLATAPDTPPNSDTPPEPVVAEVPKIFNPKRVLLLGDSMMLEGLGPQLQRELQKYPGLNVNRDGRYGTGLTRLDAFDWLAYFDEMLVKYSPDLVILTIGANDAQDILMPEGPQKRLRVGGEDWNAVYAGRVAALLAQAARRETTVFWVGLPIMGREPYGRRIAAINALAAEVCSGAPNCRFWDSWLSVADAGGRYAGFIRDAEGKSIRIRAKDAIHLTESGGRIMAAKFLAETADWADYNQSALSEETFAPPAEEAAPVETLAPSSWKAAPAPSAGDGEEEDFSAPTGTFSEQRFFSQIRHKETVYFLAAPEGPGPWPVVLLLHGAWDGAASWPERLGRERLARLAAEHGLALIMPDGEPFGWYLDGRESLIESFIIAELIPSALQKHPALDAERWGVAGLSMGGHGALTLALKHPELFKAASSLSGVTDLAAHDGPGHKLNPELRLEAALGPAGEGGRLWRERGAQGLTEEDPSRWGGRPLMLSVGRDDSLTLAENRAYHRLLTRLSIPHRYQEDEGGHNWDYWTEQLPIHLEFLGKHLRDKGNGGDS